MRLFASSAPPAGPRIGPAAERADPPQVGAPGAPRAPGATRAIGLLVAALAVCLHLLLTVVRHEALHVAGGLLTGGTVTRVEWLAGPWTLGFVEVTPPLGATSAAYRVPLLLPYLADVLLIVAGISVYRRMRLSPLARRLVVQHAVYFAALDILVNCAAAFVRFNDWTLILEGQGGWRHAVLGSIIAACAAVIVVTRRASTFGFAPRRLRLAVHTGGS